MTQIDPLLGGGAIEPVPDTFTRDLPNAPHWYKNAVFYEVLIRGFAEVLQHLLARVLAAVAYRN